MPTVAERLRALLPELYLLEDATNDLWALLQIVGATGDELQQTIADLPVLATAGGCPPDFLPFLAALVGYSYDPFSDPDRQRLGISEALEHYRRQGTLTALLRELQAAGWQGEIFETHRQVLRLNRRSRLNHQRLPGPHYNLGVFLVDCLTLVTGIADIVARHQPAGTRGWIRQAHALLATGTYLPAGATALTLIVQVRTAAHRQFALNGSALNGDDPLTRSSRDAGTIAVS